MFYYDVVGKVRRWIMSNPAFVNGMWCDGGGRERKREGEWEREREREREFVKTETNLIYWVLNLKWSIAEIGWGSLCYRWSDTFNCRWKDNHKCIVVDKTLINIWANDFNSMFWTNDNGSKLDTIILFNWSSASFFFIDGIGPVSTLAENTLLILGCSVPDSRSLYFSWF